MKVFAVSHPASLLHDTGPMHPERPARLIAVRRGIDESGLEVIDVETPVVGREELERVHDPRYLDDVEALCASGGGALDMDTVVSEASWQAALGAAGSVLRSVELLDGGEGATAFALTRPPGHHALPGKAMGFCLLNNVVVAAASLRARGERVAILDWDVHHGNGTQEMVAEDPGTLYVSLHQSPFYPFEGVVEDIDGAAQGTTVNVPLPAGTAGDVYRHAWATIVIPVVASYAPDWVLVSAGFDAHVSDPLADLRLIADDYGWMAARLSEIHPAERTVVCLEGGYDLDALRLSTAATLAGLAGGGGFDSTLTSAAGAGEGLHRVAQAVSTHWPL